MDKPEVKESNEIISSDENTVKYKSKIRAKKRKRLDSDTSTDGDDVLPENILDVERSLQASAIKNNLDDVSVKKILKKVVTNDHVLALVKLREEEEDSGTEDGLRPKLTRAKAKELMKVSRNAAPWKLELTPIKHIPVKTRPEVKALIAQELPDDEDDDEYQPTPDDVMSDDDHIIESCSDLDSQPRTPATPRSQKKSSPKIVQDGPFKVPQGVSEVCKKLDLEQEEEATIALRTRSKLSLSSTPIEHIESSFVPPDYLPVPDVDDLWNDFLQECLNPAPSARNEDDDETDPEYSVAADPDANDEDEEALENSIIKISKKELNDLVTELFHIIPQGTDEQLVDTQNILGEGANGEVKTVWEGKQEPLSDEESRAQDKAAKIQFDNRDGKTRFSIGKSEPNEVDENELTIDTDVHGKRVSETVEENVTDTPVNEAVPVREVSSSVAAPKVTITMEERESETAPPPPVPLRALLNAPPLTVKIQVDEAVEMYPQQVLLLQQQIRQHVQLAASNFLQLFVHPIHWAYAPKYKEYLMSLNKITLTNPKSVVNVCNLKPAIDLVESWESSLSENTPETIGMVEFIQKEVDKCRRRITQNSVYVGEFHELFKKVVANSSVFLYPYLLPPVPYRSEYHHKRFSYLPSEDKLIVLGLDQFWLYIENNPQLFRCPIRPHPRQRWGLATAARLVCKHMLPGVTPRALMAHVQTARRSGARDSPIVKYFTNNIIEPVKHKLLPFNPKLTLYEQPEFEMPRLWIKYLGKSSKRFRDHLYRRSQGQQPAGVELEIDKKLESVERNPLPIDFIKPIVCNRLNIQPQQPKPALVDKVDVHIQKSDQNSILNTTFFIASNIFTIVNTSTGTQLIPLKVQTSTVDSASTPICTPAIVNTTVTKENVNPEVDKSKSNTQLEPNAESKSKEVDDGHCKCCTLFRKIRRKRQTFITDYFNTSKKYNDKACDCEGKKYPKITNKLRLLVNNYRTLSKKVFNEVIAKIDKCKKGGTCNDLDECAKTHESNSKDLVTAIMFLIKLVERTNIARNNQIKRSLHTAFSKFDVENGDPVALSESLFHVFDVELADMYKEFLVFLTPKQALKLDQFKEYFTRNCVEELVAKIEEQVLDNEKRLKILENIKEIILDTASDPCEICCKLLNCASDYPTLAQYIYSLFPHRRREKVNTCSEPEKNGQEDMDQQEGSLTICEEPNVTADYEADDSSSSDAEATEFGEQLSNGEREQDHAVYDITIKYEQPEASELVIDEEEDRSSESSGMSMLVMSEDEFKTELPDWKRDEDKLILEVLKQCISPEEMKDKSIIDIIEDKNIVNMIADSLSHKSLDDVRGRILYLLEILVNDNDN